MHSWTTNSINLLKHDFFFYEQCDADSLHLSLMKKKWGESCERGFGMYGILKRMFQFRLPVNKNIIVSNKKTFWEKLIQMKKAGGSSLQVGATKDSHV